MLGVIDKRFGSGDRYHLTVPADFYMRVPESVRKSVLFIGVKEDLPEWEWKGTAYLIALPRFSHVLKHPPVEPRDGEIIQPVSFYPFMFLATARHVAEKLEGRDFALRTNKKDGTVAILEGHADHKWWYHPTERQYVDAALTVFFPPNLFQLDLHWVRLDEFLSQEHITRSNIGPGDDVFLSGLFTEVTETAANIPIVRLGNLAMMPGERIPWKDGRMIEAYLVESRSIGGLSGSPVFIRETITFDAGSRFSPRLVKTGQSTSGSLNVTGLGRFYFLGSMIGHWDAPTGFSLPENEAVNMGISPVVPAHKIKEIITQPELMDTVQKLHDELAAKKHRNAVEDFGSTRQQVPRTRSAKSDDNEQFSQEDFDDALKKATRKLESK